MARADVHTDVRHNTTDKEPIQRGDDGRLVLCDRRGHPVGQAVGGARDNQPVIFDGETHPGVAQRAYQTGEVAQNSTRPSVPVGASPLAGEGVPFTQKPFERSNSTGVLPVVSGCLGFKPGSNGC